MSYANVRRKMIEQHAPEPENVGRCHALGCPGRGSVSVEGGKFCCAAHAFVVSDRWPAVTHALCDSKWLIEFIDEIKSMDRRLEDWRGFAMQFWANQDEECAPHPKENFPPYESRMRAELLHRCGLQKRPNVRLPKPITKRGNAAAAVAEAF